MQASIEYYYKYVPQELFRVMADITNSYAIQSGKLIFKPTTSDDLEVLFGLLITTEIFNNSSFKMYWEINISISLFTKNMARDSFNKIYIWLKTHGSPKIAMTSFIKYVQFIMQQGIVA